MRFSIDIVSLAWPPKRSASIKRFVPAAIRTNARARASYNRLRVSALPIVQCALAAGLAWWVAFELLGHQRPFFAPIAAVVSLGVSLGARLRRSVELVVGVSVGIGVGDLLISGIGTGTWQIVLVVALAMITAVVLDGGPIIAMQAAGSAVLVATLIPPGNSAGFERMIDALVGGLMGVAVVGMHYTGMSAVRVTVDAAAPVPAGLEVFSFLFPVFVIGLLALAIPIAAVMMSPDRRDIELEEEANEWSAESADHALVPPAPALAPAAPMLSNRGPLPAR